MGWGKILGLATIGVAAVAAAPFTGGGSVLGAATLTASLAGAGAAATAAGTAGAVGGLVLSKREEEEAERKKRALERREFKRKTKQREQGRLFDDLKSEVQAYDRLLDVVKLLTMYSVYVCQQCGQSANRHKNEIMHLIGGVSANAYPSSLKSELNSYFNRNITKKDISNAFSVLPGNASKLLICIEKNVCINILEYESVPIKIAEGTF